MKGLDSHVGPPDAAPGEGAVDDAAETRPTPPAPLKSLEQSLVDVATDVGGAQFGAFCYGLQDDSDVPFGQVSWCGPLPSPFAALVQDRAWVANVLTRPDTTRCDDVSMSSGDVPEPLPEGRVRSYLVARVTAPDGRAQGVLLLGHEVPHQFDARTERQIAAVAAHAANAMDNSRVHQVQTEELTLAAQRRRNAEHAMRRAHDELELRVQERTRELEAVNERLQEVDRVKSDFLATMSHELRTPLNSIIGFTGVILQGLAGDLNDEQKKQLTLVYTSGQHLLKLISEILDVSRIESGKTRIQVEEFDLGSIVVHVADSLEVLVAKKRLSVELHGAAEGLVVHSDRQKVMQILLNLLGNAIKFTAQGGMHVDWSVDASGFQVSVTDTGIGIRESDLKHLFEPFRQLDQSSHLAYEGTGLGLYLSRKLAQLLGGDIGVNSVFSTGTTCTLRLPNLPMHGA